jgi:cytochrome c553
MIDISKKDDASTSQLKRITPEAFFPESESAPGVMHGKHDRYDISTGTHLPRGEVYGQPWALSEDFYLCVYSVNQKNHGVYLVDSFGNKELLYRDAKISCLDPMPLRARKRPPIIPVRTQQAKADQFDSKEKLAYGTVTIMNIYEGEYDWPKDTKIKELRIINVFSKPNFWKDKPRIGVPAQSLARGILGTVPVEKDGSVHFKCPTGMPIYFQALDEKGMMVQNMRSATYVHPGETLSCIGCHESKQDTPKNTGLPIAMKRGPSKIKPEATGSFPLTFPRLVQPVLNAKCVSCHDKEEKAKSLRGDLFAKHGWSEAFTTLGQYAWGKSGGNGAIHKKNKRSYSIPGQEGFRVSGLYKILVDKDHHGVKLTKEELRRISAWVDCNSNFYGAYYDKEKQAAGEIVKPLIGLPRLVPFEKLKR